MPVTCGAMGIRTPDLLHAMERRLVHGGLRQATCDPPELRIRPPGSAAVHAGSLRTVTSLVTSVQVSSPQIATGVQVSSPQIATGIQVSSPGTVASRRAQPLPPDRSKLPNSSVCLANFTRPPAQRPGSRHRDRAIGCLMALGQSRGRHLTQGPAARIPLLLPNAQCTATRVSRTSSAHPVSTPPRLAHPAARSTDLARTA
jgi:hypothetical protein